jgi:hypothetical protein
VLNLEPRCPHLDAEGFGLIAPGNGAAVVISE